MYVLSTVCVYTKRIETDRQTDESHIADIPKLPLSYSFQVYEAYYFCVFSKDTYQSISVSVNRYTHVQF